MELNHPPLLHLLNCMCNYVEYCLFYLCIVTKTHRFMNRSVYFSTRVLDTINSLPSDERSTMAAALTSEFILGEDVAGSLTGVQKMVYCILRHYVRQDMRRMSGMHEVYDLRDIC